MVTNRMAINRGKRPKEVRIAKEIIDEVLNLIKSQPGFYRNTLLPELKSLKWKSGPPDVPLGNNVFARRVDGFWIIYQDSVGLVTVVVIDP